MNKISITSLCSIVLLIQGCSLVRTLNMKEHNFGRQAKHIVWFQIAGLSEEHFAMLKFSKKDEGALTSIERASCLGNVWSYNLYKIRPTAEDAFIAQLTGSNDIVDSCKKFEKKYVWEMLDTMGFYSGVLELQGSSVESKYLTSSRHLCSKELRPKLNDMVMWKMSSRGKDDADSMVFHYQDINSGKEESGIFFDRSCNESGCYSSILNNAKSLHKNYSTGKSQYLFMVRDFSYLEALSKKNVAQVQEILYELDKTIQYFVDESMHDENMLVLVTTAASKKLEFPKFGKEWFIFDKESEYLTFKSNALISPLYASGAGAENFCGFYKEYEVTKRVVEAASKGKIKFKLLNFF